LVNELIGELQKQQIQILVASYITEVDQKAREDLIEVIKENVSFINEDIEDLEKRIENEKPYTRRFNVEDKMKRDQVSTLRLELQDIMFDFSTTQLVYRDQCKARIKRQLQISGYNKSEVEVEEMIERNDMDVFKAQLNVEAENTCVILEEVTRRHQEIVKLEKSLQDLFSIFENIALFVEYQGDMINSIERNVGEVAQLSGFTNANVKQAYRYKRRKLATLCFPCLGWTSSESSCAIL